MSTVEFTIQNVKNEAKMRLEHGALVDDVDTYIDSRVRLLLASRVHFDIITKMIPKDWEHVCTMDGCCPNFYDFVYGYLYSIILKETIQSV